MNFRKTISSMTGDQKWAFGVAVTFWLSWFVTTFVLWYLAAQPASSVSLSLAASASLALVGWLAGMMFMWRGKFDLAAYLILGFTWATFLLMVMFVEKNTVFTVLIGAMVTVFYTALSVPSKHVPRVLIIASLAAAFLVLLDSYWPFIRQPANQVITIYEYIGTAVMVLLVLAFFSRRVPDFSLRTKLTAAMLLIAALPIIGLSLASVTASRRNLTDAANQSLFALAAQISTALDTFYRNNLDGVRIEAQLSIIRDYIVAQKTGNMTETVDQKTQNTLLALSRKDPANIRSYALLSDSGEVLLSTDPGEIGMNMYAFEHTQQALFSGLPTVSRVIFDTENNEQSLYFTAPVRDDAKIISGAIQVKYDAAILQQVVFTNSTQLGEESSALLLDDNLLILANSSTPEYIYRVIQPDDSKQFAVLQEQKRLPPGAPEDIFIDLSLLKSGLANLHKTPFFSTEMHVFHEGESAHKELASAVKMSAMPWSVVVSQAEDILLAPVVTQTRSNTIIALLAAAATVVISLLFTEFLVRPLRSLTETARRVAAGDLTARYTVQNHDEIGVLGNTFNSMTNQLRILIDSLEQRVADRTKALATSTDVSRRLSTILDQSELVREVVSQLQSAFGYYHVHIYLMDENKEKLVMSGGTGLPGEILLARGHTVPVGRGLVGRAAETNTSVLVQDVTQDSNWLPNPLLPETHSEVAVPISIGSDVVGVLDVQHNVALGLAQEDADLIQAIANQVAIALRNARAFASAQRQAQREALAASITQRIQQTNSMQDALKVAAREIGRAMGKRPTRVRLVTNTPEDGQD